ncbi:MAG: ATP-binding cassette domain-containing protein [Erysipelotrichaceae bacterium]|nr:ATP-binding cassette domain-containing protein [Erysipelotrichaceae bacterium]
MRINNLDFSYDKKQIFHDYSLDLSDGITCLMGASGKGKTTLLKLMAGLLKPDNGTVDIDDRKVSFMFQEDRLLPWLNVRENVLLVTGREKETDELLQELGIDGNLKISELSGGMARRVALARCLMFESDVLLMDEPFKGLDEELMKKVASIIVRQNKPTIVSTHSLDEVEALGGEIVNL